MSERVRMTRAERQAETRERLMTAATEVFAERGVAAATVEEICERAGFSRGAFYSNFESKDEVCLAIVAATKDETLQILADTVSSPSHGSADAVDAMLTLFLARIPIGSSQLLLHQELTLHAQRDPDFRKPFRELISRTQEQIGALLTTVMAAHHRRLTVDVSVAARLLEGEFLRNERDAALFEDADGGRRRVRESLAQVVHLVSEPLG